MNTFALWLETLALMSAPADLPPPTVIMDAKNFYLDGEVHLRDDQCFATAAVHEFSHYVAIATGRLDGIPNELAKKRLEDIARDVEQRATTWQPNCETRDNQ